MLLTWTWICRLRVVLRGGWRRDGSQMLLAIECRLSSVLVEPSSVDAASMPFSESVHAWRPTSRIAISRASTRAARPRPSRAWRSAPALSAKRHSCSSAAPTSESGSSSHPHCAARRWICLPRAASVSSRPLCWPSARRCRRPRARRGATDRTARRRFVGRSLACGCKR